MNVGDPVWYAQHGTGAVPGRVVREYVAESPFKPDIRQRRIIVQLDDPARTCPVDAFASSVFATRAEAEREAAR